MNLHMLVNSLLTSLALIVAIAALYAAREALQSRPRRLLIRMTELEAELEKMQGWYKKLNANYALLIARSKRHPSEDEQQTNGGALDIEQAKGETAAQWKARMRRQMASGGLKHE